MERAHGSGAAGAVTGLDLSFFLSFFSFGILSLHLFICQRGRRVAGGELRHLARSPEGGGGD